MMLQPNELHQLCEEDIKTGELEVLCEEVTVLRRKEDLLTGKIQLELGLWCNGKLKCFEMDRALLCGKRFLRTLMGQGLSVVDDKDTAEAIGQYLLTTEQNAPNVSTHAALGFADLHGSMVYLADTVIGTSVKSNFHEPTMTAPKGTLDSWKELMEAEVLGRDNLELALAIGVSAPVAHLLRENRLYTENPIWALIGQSSTGKTTALRLMASVFGSPEEDTGIINDLNTTENALLQLFGEHKGWPMIIDEATSQPKWDFASTVYYLSKGKDKNRCSRSSETIKPRTFSGTVIISGESSLVGQSRQTLGMYARMVELTLDWTEDADHARRLADGCRKNYGTAIVPIAENLLQWQRDSPDVFHKEFSKELQRLREKIGKVSGPEERHLNMYATVIFSAKSIKKVLGLSLDIKKMRDLLTDIHRKAPKSNTVAERLYDAILDEIATHGGHFPKTNKQNQLVLSDMWGERSNRGGKTVVWITEQTFARFAKKHNFPNYKGYLSELSSRGLLEKFHDRYLEKHRIGNSIVKCYCLIMESSI